MSRLAVTDNPKYLNGSLHSVNPVMARHSYYMCDPPPLNIILDFSMLAFKALSEIVECLHQNLKGLGVSFTEEDKVISKNKMSKPQFLTMRMEEKLLLHAC